MEYVLVSLRLNLVRFGFVEVCMRGSRIFRRGGGGGGGVQVNLTKKL